MAISPTYTHKQQNTHKKKKGAWAPPLLRVDNGAHLHPSSLFAKSWQWSPLAPTSNKTKGKKKGVWVPPLLRLDDGVHLHPQTIKHKEKKKEFVFLPKLGDGAHPLLEAIKQKEKKEELAFVESWERCPPKPKPKPKEKRKIGCLPLSSCFQTFHSLSSKLSTLQILSSLNPNVQLVGDGVITGGIWGRWVGRLREVDGLVERRVVGFRFVGEKLK